MFKGNRMEYKIIDANAAEGTITVRYLYKDFNVATFVIDVPIVDGKYITGQALEDLIQSRAPLELLQRRIDIENAANFVEIESKVDPSVLARPAADVPEPVYTGVEPNTIVVQKLVV
jgi:hypothetical protein